MFPVYGERGARNYSALGEPLDLAILRCERESGAVFDRPQDFGWHPIRRSRAVRRRTSAGSHSERSDRRRFRDERQSLPRGERLFEEIFLFRFCAGRNTRRVLVLLPADGQRRRNVLRRCRVRLKSGRAGRRDGYLSRGRWRIAHRRGRADQLRAVWFRVSAEKILHERKANASLAPPVTRL